MPVRRDQEKSVGGAALPRCPFGGGSSLQIGLCPGFTLSTVATGDIDGTAGVLDTCRHLAAAADGRGYYPACHHPESEWVVPAARLVALGGSERNQAGFVPAGAASSEG